jgi:hypothetical protein
MANYKDIQGFHVQNLTSDPTPYAQALSDNPYAGAWASGGNLNTARMGMAGNGVQTAAIASGGRNSWSPPNFTFNNLTEQYDGSSWTEVAELNTARAFTGSGGTSSGQIIAGGSQTTALFTDETNLVEIWNGSAWSETTEINTARNALGGDGASSSATLVVGGKVPPHSPTSATDTDVVESWNGSAWTEVGDLNTGRYGMAANGTYTAMIASGGQTNPPPSQVNNVETWNGSSWTEVAEINTTRVFLAGSGTSTSQLAFGGSDPGGPGVTKTESWNGSSWTEVNDLATSRMMLAGDGASNTSAIAFGGSGDGYSPDKNETEEWSFSGLDPSSTPAAGYSNALVGQVYYNTSLGQFKSIKEGVGSWSSGGNINTKRDAVGGSRGGTQTSTLIFGGQGATAQTALTEQYDGSSWTEVADLATARRAGGGFGTTTASLFAGGVTDMSHLISTNAVESWNGSSWTETTEMGTRRFSGFNAGVYTAGIIASGLSRPGSPPGSPITYRTLTETWNGSAWTETGDMNVGRYDGGGTGTTTSMLAVGGSGFPSAPGTYGSVESFNGSSWTEITDINTARSKPTGAGDNTAALVAGGGPSSTAKTENWDGTSWTEVADLGTARSANDSGAGTISAMIIASGTDPAGNLTEEWNKPDFEIKTVTTS